MKVLRLHKPFDLRLHDEPMPGNPGPGEALIKVASVGICASDIHYYREGRIGDQIVKEPIILGHEFSAIVESVGEGVTSVKPGDRVAVEPGSHCGECALCREGLINLCPNIIFFGTPPVDGCLREYLIWPASLLMPVSDEVSLDEAAMIEPLAVGVYAVDLSGLKGGETIAILGAGAIGLSVLQAAKAKGVKKAIVSELVPERAEVAKRLGADETIDARPTDPIKAIRELTGGMGPEFVFECTGQMTAVRQATQAVRPEGTVVVVGIPEEDEYCFPASAARRREVTVKFVRRSRNAAHKSIEMVENGSINVKSYGTHHFPIEESKEAFELAAAKTDGVVRAVIRLF